LATSISASVHFTPWPRLYRGVYTFHALTTSISASVHIPRPDHVHIGECTHFTPWPRLYRRVYTSRPDHVYIGECTLHVLATSISASVHFTPWHRLYRIYFVNCPFFLCSASYICYTFLRKWPTEAGSFKAPHWHNLS